MKNFLINIILLAVFNLLSLLNKDNFAIGLVIFVLLTYLPGGILFSLIKISSKSFMEKISIATGLGTLFLMLLGLGINTFYPFFGIHQPLSQIPVLITYDCLLVILFIIEKLFNKTGSKSFFIPHFSLKTFNYVCVSLFIPLSALLGAFSLNNNGTGIIAFCTYILIGIYSSLILFFNKKLSTNKIVFSLFIISITLLFMNSLRGWFITGHDIQEEFYVFQLTKTHNFWNINAFKDPYNACLSLNILPTIYANITKINDYYIYKVLYQLIFSFTAVNIYFILKRYLSGPLAYMAALNFLFFPTFLTDMPMLNRQEIAFLYLSLMLYFLFDNTIKSYKKTILFSLMGMGMILSHYSTSYVAIGLLVLVYILSLFVSFIRWILWSKKETKSPFIKRSWERNLNIVMVTFLLLFSVFWNSIYTKTSGHVEKALLSISDNIVHPFKETAKSGESLYSIIGFKQLSNETLLQNYIKDKTTAREQDPNASNYYSRDLYSKYPVDLAPIEVLKPSSIFANIDPLKMFSFVSNLRQSYAKIIQILIIIGMLTIPFYKKVKSEIHYEYYLLGLVSIFVILVELIIPQNAVDYGILRLFQQSLLFFSIFIVIGFYRLLDLFKIFTENSKIIIITAFTLFYFFLLSGVLPQLFGGYYPQLPLNNSGLYYDLYYSRASEINSLKWIGTHADKDLPLQTDSFDSSNIETYAGIAPESGILPLTIKKDSYVYLNSFNTKYNTVYLYYDASLISYKNPVAFLNDNKNLIYSTGVTKIYK